MVKMPYTGTYFYLNFVVFILLQYVYLTFQRFAQALNLGFYRSYTRSQAHNSARIVYGRNG